MKIINPNNIHEKGEYFVVFIVIVTWKKMMCILLGFSQTIKFKFSQLGSEMTY